jgi:hypothetical protein
MAAAASNEETKSENNNNNDEVNEVGIITVGRFVEVASRTWPGINKPGGVARVVEVHFDTSSDDETNDNDNENEKEQGVGGKRNNPTHVNVRYMVGTSREKRVPVEYVQLAPQYETHRPTTKDSSVSTSAGGNDSGNGNESGNYVASSLRDRSMLLGRCRRCGSLRTDCGSCDWAVEEEAALSATFAGNKKTITSKKSSALAKTRKKDKKQHTFVDSLLFDDDSDDSSISNNDEDDGGDDDDDDMTRLRKLIHATQRQRRRRKHSKNEEKFSDPSLDDNNDTSIMAGKEAKSRLQLQKYRKSTANTKWRRRYPVLIDDSSSSSDSYDSEVKESNHSKGRKKSTESGSLRSNRRNLTGGKSILEDLPAIRGADASNEKQPKITTSSLSTSASASTSKISRQQRRQTSHTLESLQLLSSSDSDSDNMPVSSVADLRRHNKTSSSKQSQSRETSSDISLNIASSNARKSVTSAVAETASYDHQLLELEARARFQMEQQQQNSSTFPSTAVGDNDADAGFIQPEGQEAVENLPEDMVDLSRSVPYKDLGSFFDSMATRIEDEMLPDFKLKMAGLHHRLRTLQNKQAAIKSRMDNAPDTADTTPASAKQLLEEYHRLWEEVCLSMIQNGTDQCRATLRRLMDDKLYRKHRKQLTAEQRKRYRGPGIMDSRNLRMDAMDDVVEAFVRKLKDAVVTCETECVEIDSVDIGNDKDDDDDNSAGGDIYYDDDTSSGEDDNLDFLPITAMANNDRVGNELAPFDPHEHASRVRKERPKHETMQSKKSLYSASKTTSSKNAYPPSRKRPRTTNFNMTEVGDQSTKGSSFRSAIQVDTNDVEQEEKLQNTDESTVVMSDAEGPSIDPVKKSFETDGAFTSIHSNTMVGAKTKRKRKTRSRNLQPRFAEPRDQKQSISERMQAFLDANVGNGMRICSEDEETEAELIHSRGRETNNHKQQRRQLSIFEPTTKQKGVQNDESRIGAQAGIEDQGENEEERQETQLTSYDTNALFVQLSDRTRLSEEFAETLMNGDSSNLDKNWEGLLSEMEIALSNNSESMNLFLQKAYDMLVSHGSRTIQDMIASKEAELSLHIRTLSLCVRSLKFVSNDEVPTIFTKEIQECFLNFLVFQMVDALYSSSLPSAWALGIENCERVIHKLIPLRNALASRIPLVEAVSRCVIRSLECQQWRKSKYKNHVFVSSLNPKCWSDFLETGRKFDDPQGT